MPSATLTSIPAELIQEIALHLPSTYDVLAFRLTNHVVSNALFTAALHKRRVALAGWDVELWEADHEASPETADEQRMRWFRIDHMHSVLQELMFGPQFLERVQIMREPRFVSYIGNLQGSSPVDDPGFLSWLVRVAEVLPPILAHNVARNVRRLEVCPPWQVIIDALDELLANPRNSKHPGITIGSRTFSYEEMLERLSFSLSMLFTHANPAFIAEVFDDFFPGGRVEMSLLNLQGLHPEHQDIVFAFRNPDSNFVATRNATCFMAQAVIYSILVQPQSHDDSWTISAPSLPPLARGADWSFMTFQLRIRSSRPWLASACELLRTRLTQGETSWLGYYSLVAGHQPCLDPPMRIVMRAPLPDERKTIFPLAGPDGYNAGEVLEFVGHGQDDVGPFRMNGRANMESGIVDAMKNYDTHSWTWSGILTPFGMVGKWGTGRLSGWWWIWPEEWDKQA